MEIIWQAKLFKEDVQNLTQDEIEIMIDELDDFVAQTIMHYSPIEEEA